MSFSSDRETPKKAVKGRPTKEQSCNDFCRVCRCNFKSFYGDFKRRVSTENLFEPSKRTGVEKCRLADLVTELGFSCEKNVAESNRVCAKCATKIRNASELMRYLKSGFLAPEEHPIAMTCSPIAAERFKRMSGSPHSANSGKIGRTDSPKEDGISKLELEPWKASTARRSISHSFANAIRQEISELMSAQEVEKPAVKVVIPTGDDTYSFRSTPDAATANIVKNIFVCKVIEVLPNYHNLFGRQASVCFFSFDQCPMIRPCEIHRQLSFRFRVLRAQISTNLGILLTGIARQNKK